MIVGVTGQKGSGKTRLLVKLGKENHTAGRRVISNFDLGFPHERIEDIQDAKEELHDAVVLLQEVHTLVDSRNSMEKGRLNWTYFFLETRKIDVDLIWDSQFFNQPDTRLRNATDIVIEARATAWEIRDGRAWATEFEYTAKRPDGATVTWQDKLGDEVALYNTREVSRQGGANPFMKPVPTKVKSKEKKSKPKARISLSKLAASLASKY